MFVSKWDHELAFADLKRAAEALGLSPRDATASTEELQRQFDRAGRHIRYSRPLPYVFVCVATIMIAVQTVSFAKLSFISSAVVHYEQVLKISAPFLTESDRRQIESQFSRVESKTDYLKVVDGLEKIAKDHGQRVPGFRPW